MFEPTYTSNMESITSQQITRIGKYTVVGILGTIVDIGTLVLLVEKVRTPLLLASTLSFCISLAHNFLLNKWWTFHDAPGSTMRQSIKYAITALFGLILNNAVLFVLVYIAGIWYVLAKLITSAVIVAWNFSMNNFWTFSDQRIPRPLIEPQEPRCEVSLVIPAFNEEKNIRATLEAIDVFMSKKQLSHEVIVVDDGSTDGTREKIEEWKTAHPSVSLISYHQNRGKGYAVRNGMKCAQGRLHFFMDADGSTPITELEKSIPVLGPLCDVVIGSRYLAASAIIIHQPLYRVLLGRIGNVCIRMLLLQGITDTQCGWKGFTAEASLAIFSRQTIDGWGFDMELLALSRYMGFRVMEIPVSWSDSTVRKSRLRPFRDAHHTLRDLLCVKLNLLTKRYHLPIER